MSPGSEDLLSQREKREVLENDRRIRERGTTYSTFAEAFADESSQGRFRATGTPIVTGATATPAYPAGPDWTAVDPVPDEPPLGFSVEDHEPVGTEREIQASIERLGETVLPSGPPNGGEVEAPSSEPQLDVEPASPFPNKPDDDEPPHAD